MRAAPIMRGNQWKGPLVPAPIVARETRVEMSRLFITLLLTSLILRPEAAQAQSVLERVLLLLDFPNMVALNVAESFIGPASPDVFDPRYAGVDGSITTVIYGLDPYRLDDITASYSSLQQGLIAVELGLTETTAIGGVNTGKIGLSETAKTDALAISIAVGVQAAVDEAHALSAQAVSASAQTLGGATGSQYLAANMSSNVMAVQGQVTNILQDVSVTMNDVRATALGAVNTGAIASGVDTIVKGLTGMSGDTAALR